MFGYEYFLKNLSDTSSLLHTFQPFLTDTETTDTFAAALARLVNPGKSIVVEFNPGPGIFSLLAAKAGAKKVYIFNSEAPDLLRDIVRENGYTNIVEIIETSFEKTNLPHKADIIFTSQIDIFDTTLTMLNRAKKALGHNRTILVPQEVITYCAPTCVPLSAVDIWRNGYEGLRFNSIADIANTVPHTNIQVPEKSLLAYPEICHQHSQVLDFTFRKSGTLYGFAFWYEARLASNISYATRPGTHTKWQQWFFPVQHQVAISEHTLIQAVIDVEGAQITSVDWRLPDDRDTLHLKDTEHLQRTMKLAYGSNN